MRGKTKRIGSLLMASMLVTSMLTGCGGDNGAKVPTTSKKIKVADGFNKDGLPIVETPTEINVLTMRWGNMGDTFLQNKWLKELEKNTNVKVNWQIVSSNDWAEQKSILLASGELPEVILGSETFNDGDILGNLDYFIPLDDLIDQYMPNLKVAMEKTPALRKAVTASDGHIYALPSRRVYSSKCINQAIINKKWLDNLGLDIPKDTEELYQVLKAFKEKDANGNGDPNDEIPYTSSGPGLNMSFLMPFGINNSGYMGVENKKVIFYPTTAKFKAGIEYMHKLYSEGIIDQEIFTQDGTMKTAKSQNPDVSLVGFAYEWIPDATFGQWGDEYITIPALAGPDGKRYQQGDATTSGITRNQLEITKFCKHPEIVARWADQWYTNEAAIQNQWGSIGVVIKDRGNDVYEVMDPPKGTSADAWYWEQSLRDFGPKYATDEFESKIILPENSGDGLKKKIAKMSEEYVTENFPNVMFTTDETEELAMLATDINKYVDSNAAKWITEGGIGSDWEAYVNKLNAMGLKRYLEIQNTAYNRYQGK
ncbi:MAG: extracellular solute-binding protein [Cellulosilyticaceae bacterium]